MKQALGGLFLAATWGFTALAADARPIINVTYYDYPPTMQVVDGRPAGTYVARMMEIAEAAGIRIHWLPSSINEESQMLDQGVRQLCTTGRLHNEERAKRWLYVPYEWDWLPGDIILARPDAAARVAMHSQLLDLLHDSELRPMFVGGSTFGNVIDKAIKTRDHWVPNKAGSEIQVIRLIASGRADYTIVAFDQWEHALSADPSLATLTALKMEGVLPPAPIYLTCSNPTPKTVIEAMGKAMEKLGYKYRPDIH